MTEVAFTCNDLIIGVAFILGLYGYRIGIIAV